MTAACPVPRANSRAASKRRASNAATSRRPSRVVAMPQHGIVPDEHHQPISRDSLVPGQLTSPDLLSPPLAAEPLSSKRHVLGRQQPSTYTHVRLGLLPSSDVAVRAEGRSPEARAELMWLGIWPGTPRSSPRWSQFPS